MYRYIGALVGVIFLIVSCSKPLIESTNGARVIAHRGYWDTDSSAQNSITSLRKAYDLGAAGVEFDISTTMDDTLVIIHGPEHGAMIIEDTYYDTLNMTPLENNESIPTLREYLDAVKLFPELTLFVDIKTDRHIYDIYHLIENVVDNECYYMSFSLPTCLALRQLNEDIKILYLGGGYSPQELIEYNLSGFNYPKEALLEHPEYLSDAKAFGLITAVWTVNGKDELSFWLSQPNIDFITTDTPDLINLNK